MLNGIKIIKLPRLRHLFSFLLLSFPVILFIAVSGERENVSMTKENEYILIIDPGHGGIDCGATGADGSKESDINLAIALKLRALAEFCGHNNSMTRNDDTTMSDTPNYSEHRDLERRAEIVNEALNPIYISIHQNFYPTGQPGGPLVIYASNEESEKFGKLMHQNMICFFAPESRRVAEPALDKYYVLSHVNCPAILLECGFMSNFSDMEKLKSAEHQTAVAAVIMASSLQYIQNTRYV